MVWSWLVANSNGQRKRWPFGLWCVTGSDDETVEVLLVAV